MENCFLRLQKLTYFLFFGAIVLDEHHIYNEWIGKLWNDCHQNLNLKSIKINDKSWREEDFSSHASMEFFAPTRKSQRPEAWETATICQVFHLGQRVMLRLILATSILAKTDHFLFKSHHFFFRPFVFPPPSTL